LDEKARYPTSGELLLLQKWNVLYHYVWLRIRILPSNSQQVETTREAIYRVANLSEHPHTTRPPLDVLAQPAKRGKLDSAIRLWASVNPVRVARALQVQIEVCEGPKRRPAQETLVCHPIPRALRRPCRRRGRRLVPTQGPSEKSGGIRDVIIRISADDDAVQLFACHARGASARLEVEGEGGGGDKGSVTAAAGTAQVGGLVDPGIQVVTEVALALEKTVAVSAVMMPWDFVCSALDAHSNFRSHDRNHSTASGHLNPFCVAPRTGCPGTISRSDHNMPWDGRGSV
jgi:hypothetical protein